MWKQTLFFNIIVMEWKDQLSNYSVLFTENWRQNGNVVVSWDRCSKTCWNQLRERTILKLKWKITSKTENFFSSRYKNTKYLYVTLSPPEGPQVGDYTYDLNFISLPEFCVGDFSITNYCCRAFMKHYIQKWNQPGFHLHAIIFFSCHKTGKPQSFLLYGEFQIGALV